MAGRIAGITIEINGDTTKLSTALKNVDKDIKSTQKSLKDVEKLLKLDPSNTTLLEQKQRLLADAVKDTASKLNTLKDAQQQAKAQLESGELGQDKYDALQREIVETENELKQLAIEAGKSNKAVSDLSNVSEGFKKVGGSLTDIGKKMTTNVTVPLAAVGAGATKVAADFESSMSQVQATLGITKDAQTELNGATVNTMDALSDLAREMGGSTAFSAGECADAINTLAQSGLDAQQIYDALPDVLNLAAAGGISIADAATYATGAVKGFGDEMGNASHYADLIAKGSSLANTDVNELGRALSEASATAKTYGQDADSTTLALLRLAESNVTGSEAATGLSAAMTRVYAPTSEAKKAMEELGVAAYTQKGKARDFNDVVDDLSKALSGMSEEEANAATKAIFGSSRLGIFNDMTASTTDHVDELKNGLEGCSGAAEEMAGTQLDNLNGHLTILKSAFDEAAISIGERLIPYIDTLVGWIQSAVEWFNGLSDSQLNLILTVVAVIAALGPIITIVGNIATVIGTVIGAISTVIGFVTSVGTLISAGTPLLTALVTVIGGVNIAIVAIIGVIAAVIAAGVALYKNWDTIKEKAAAFVSAIKEKWSAFVSATKEKFESIKNTIANIWEAIKTKITSVVSNISSSIQSKFNAIKSNITNVINNIKSVITSGIEAAKAAFEGKIEAMKAKVSSVFSNISSTISNVISNVKRLLTGEMSFPKIKIPHISVSGGTAPYGIFGRGTKPTISISYYAKGYDEIQALDNPAIFGMAGNALLAGGERRGRELVGGESHFVQLVESVVAKQLDSLATPMIRMENLMATYYPAMAAGGDVYLDSDVLVGRTAQKMNSAIGAINLAKTRRGG